MFLVLLFCMSSYALGMEIEQLSEFSKVHRNMQSMFAVSARQGNSWEVNDKYSATRNISTDPAFNYVFCNEDIDSNEIRSLNKDFPSSVWFTSSSGNINATLKSLRYEIKKPFYLMYVSFNIIQNQEVVSSVTVQPITGMQQIKDFAQVYCASRAENKHELEKFFNTCTMESPLLQDSATRLFVGYVGNKPCSTAIIHIAANTLGIYSVHIDPQFKHHGYEKKCIQKILTYCQEQKRNNTLPPFNGVTFQADHTKLRDALKEEGFQEVGIMNMHIPLKTILGLTCKKVLHTLHL